MLDGFFEGYFHKEAGMGSEIAGTLLNPVNLATLPLGPLVGFGAGMTQQHKESPEDIEERNEEMWKNLLIPFRAPYNLGKRSERHDVETTVQRMKDKMKKKDKSPEEIAETEEKMRESFAKWAPVKAVGITALFLTSRILSQYLLS